jgi:hypothetical protein
LLAPWWGFVIPIYLDLFGVCGFDMWLGMVGVYHVLPYLGINGEYLLGKAWTGTRSWAGGTGRSKEQWNGALGQLVGVVCSCQSTPLRSLMMYYAWACECIQHTILVLQTRTVGIQFKPWFFVSTGLVTFFPDVEVGKARELRCQRC